MDEKMQKSEKRFEPDVRFLLANERTLLAWIRTSIALQAGGLALAHFGSNHSAQRVLSILIIALGGWIGLNGLVRFRAADKAIRASQLPSIGYAILIQSFSVVLIAVILIIGLIVAGW